MFLVNRDAGAVLTLTLWDSEQRPISSQSRAAQDDTSGES
jgi:hypothetical protein